MFADHVETNMLYLHKGTGCHMTASSPHPIYIAHSKDALQLVYACSMVTLSGQIPGNYKLKYQLAEHTDEELQAARRIHMAANSSRTPGSGLIPQQQIYRVMPPYQTLANPDHATEPTRYSHMHLNGLPASQSAAASPLGFLNNKLMAFGQSGTLNGRNREEIRAER